MNNETLGGFISGLCVGMTLTLTGGYFFGTTVLHKALREHDLLLQPAVENSQQYLQQAQNALDADSDYSDEES